MKIRWRYIVLSLGLVISLGIAILNGELFSTYVIAPVADILWLVYKTFLSVIQEVYWALLILTTVILILFMIPDYHEVAYRTAYNKTIQINDRVAYWETLLRSAEVSENDRLVLQRELEALNLLISDLVGESGEEIILMPRSRGHIRQYIRATWMSSFLSRIIRRKAPSRRTELEKCVNTIVSSMENQMEINHDRESNQTRKN